MSLIFLGDLLSCYRSCDTNFLKVGSLCLARVHSQTSVHTRTHTHAAHTHTRAHTHARTHTHTGSHTLHNGSRLKASVMSDTFVYPTMIPLWKGLLNHCFISCLKGGFGTYTKCVWLVRLMISEVNGQWDVGSVFITATTPRPATQGPRSYPVSGGYATSYATPNVICNAFNAFRGGRLLQCCAPADPVCWRGGFWPTNNIDGWVLIRLLSTV